MFILQKISQGWILLAKVPAAERVYLLNICIWVIRKFSLVRCYFWRLLAHTNWCLHNQLYYIYLNKCGAGYLTFHTSLVVSVVSFFHPTCSADWLDDIKCLWPSSSQVAKGMSKWYCAISLHFFRFQNSLRNLMNKGWDTSVKFNHLLCAIQGLVLFSNCLTFL